MSREKMDAARYARVQEIFEEARAVPEMAQGEFVADACGHDADLCELVLTLLHAARREADPDGTFSEAKIEAARAHLEESFADEQSGAANIPTIIGPYRIIRRIASGGMGTVYEAEQDSPRRRVALKMVHAQRSTPDMLERLRRESEVLGRLQHPGIAHVYEAGMVDFGDGAQPYFAMEYIDGVPLTKYADVEAIDARGRLELLATVCDAAHYAHGKGIVHRDLKPDNILVDAQGRPRILDFGVARVTSDSTIASETMTGDGEMIGTLSYMAPEQVDSGTGPITPRADVYALGVIAFELLTGRVPHDVSDLSIAACVRVLLEHDPPRLGDIDPRHRGDVQTIIGKALEREPQRRYDAAGLAADIRRFLNDEPIRARPPSLAYRVRKFVRRNRALTGGTLATMITLVIGTVVALVFAHAARTQRDLADDRAIEARRNATIAGSAVLQATQSLLDAGQWWEARKQHESIPDAARGWCWRLVGRCVPVELTAPEVPMMESGHVPAWWFIDRDRLARISPDRGVEIYSVLERRIVANLFENHGFLRLAHAASTPCGGDFVVRNQLEHLRLDLDRGVILDRWPASTIRSLDGRIEVRSDRAGVGDEVWVDGRFVRRLPASTVTAIAPDGRHLLVRTSEAGASPARGNEIQEVETEVVRFRGDGDKWIRFTPAGNALVGSSTRPHLRRIELTQRPGGVNHVDLAPEREDVVHVAQDERFLSICPGGGIAPVLRDAVTGAPHLASRFQDERGFFSDFIAGRAPIAPDGTRLLLEKGVYRAPWIVELDPREREPGFDPRGVTLAGHVEWAYHVAVSNDGSLIASAAPLDPHVRLWDAQTGEQIATLERRCATYASWDMLMVFTPDDERLVLTTPFADHRMALVDWHLATGSVEAVSLDESRARDRHVQLLDDFIERVGPAARARLSQRAQMFGDTAIALSVHAHGEHTKSPSAGDLDGGPRWRLAPTDAARGIEARGLAVHPTEPQVAVVSRRVLSEIEPGYTRVDTGTLLIVDANTSAEVVRLELEHVPWCCGYSPDGSLLAIGMADGTVVFVETEFHTVRYTMQAHADAEFGYVYSLAWTPDGTRLVTVSGDTTVKIWDGRFVPVSRKAIDDWRTLRAAMAGRADLAEAYGTLTGTRRAAARVELLRRRQPAAD